MPKSQFRPDPNVVQSGYYNNREGMPDRSVTVDGAMHKSAEQENSQARPEVAARLSGGGSPVPTDPASIIKALQNGGVPPPEVSPSEQEMDFTPSTTGSNPYLNAEAVQSGWFTKAQPKGEADGLVDFDVLQAELSKGAIQPQDENFEPNEEPEEDEEDEDVEKHYGPASEDSTHPEVHNTSGRTGLDSVGDADKWAVQKGQPGDEAIACKEKKVTKSYGLDEMNEWLQKSIVELDDTSAVEVLDSFLQKGQLPPIGIQEHANARASGYGSRGGKIVGRTKSGKPIYASKPKSSPEDKEKKRAEMMARMKAAKQKLDAKTEKSMSNENDLLKGMSGGMTTSEPPGQMPTRGLPNPFDGGKVDSAGKGNGASDAGSATAASTSGAPGCTIEDIEYDDHDVDLRAMAGGTRLGTMTKSAAYMGQTLDWGNAVERSHQMRSLAKSIMESGDDGDVQIHDIGAPDQFVQNYEEDEEVEEFGKGMVFHSDRTDRAIEKAFNRHGDGSTVFAQTSVPGVDIRSPLFRQIECGECGSLMKSFTTVCGECGSDQRGEGRQGVSYSQDLQKALAGHVED